MLSVKDISEHRMFRGLPRPELDRMADTLEDVQLLPGEIVCEAGMGICHAYFIRRGVISLFVKSNGQADVGVGLILAHGLFGLAAVAGEKTSALSAMSQGHSSTYRIGVDVLARQIELNTDFGRRVFRYSVSLLTQFALTTACFGQHSSQMRLARWMLDVSEGHDSESFSSTQDAMATAIGVQRAVVSKVAGQFQTQGLIRYVRGQVTVLDRSRLTAAACTCNAGRLRYS